MKIISDYLQIIVDTPWKFINEIGMYLIKPFVLFYLRTICGVKVGKGSKFYGFPKVFRHRGSTIIIGNGFECRNWRYSNPLGINHPTIICTWKNRSKIVIGNNVGISGGSIVAAEEVKIGDGTLIGANATIIDNDFHPISSNNRRYDSTNIKSRKVKIGKNVFLGTGCLILKGVVITDNSVVPAGQIVR